MPSRELHRNTQRAVDAYAIRLRELLASCAEHQQHEPEVFLWNARRALEAMCHILASVQYDLVSSTETNRGLTLEQTIGTLHGDGALDEEHRIQFHTIRSFANLGVHIRGPEREDFPTAVNNLGHVLPSAVQWLIHDSRAAPYIRADRGLKAAIDEIRAGGRAPPSLAETARQWQERYAMLERRLRALETTEEMDEALAPPPPLRAPVLTTAAAIEAPTSSLAPPPPPPAASAPLPAASASPLAVSVPPPEAPQAPPSSLPPEPVAPRAAASWIVWAAIGVALAAGVGIGVAAGLWWIGSRAAAPAERRQEATNPGSAHGAPAPAAASSTAPASVASCPDGMVHVPAGELRLGQPIGRPKLDWPSPSASPLPKSSVGAFCIDAAPRTRAQFAAWVGDRAVAPTDCAWDAPERAPTDPVVCVDRDSAADYCAAQAPAMKLPSIEQWERLLRVEPAPSLRYGPTREWAEDLYPPAALARRPDPCLGKRCQDGMFRQPIPATRRPDADGNLLWGWYDQEDGKGWSNMTFRCTLQLKP